MSLTAVLSPTPGIPGRLSLESPLKPLKSMICLGSKPYVSLTSSGVIATTSDIPLRIMFTLILSVTNWRKSLSDVYRSTT